MRNFVAFVVVVVAFVALSTAATGCYGDSAHCELGAVVDGGLGDANDPGLFCDSHNPCVTDATCTPCSSLPPGTPPTIYNCTPDNELPPLCMGLTGCVHMVRTTPPGQVNDCFPVAGSAEDGGPISGVCRTGVCVPNPEPEPCTSVTACGLKCGNCLTALGVQPNSCRVVFCDVTGAMTDPGAPPGCWSVPASPGATCSTVVGAVTCPGTCSGPVNDAGIDTCQPLFPMCGA